MAADACDDGNGIILAGSLPFDFGFDPSNGKVSAILFTYQNRYDKLIYVNEHNNKKNKTDETNAFFNGFTLNFHGNRLIHTIFLMKKTFSWLASVLST